MAQALPCRPQYLVAVPVIR
uniref:Uncharacterized protein n=1 Tax=Arundo donax TaxID=35708 RepID=A0A0A8YN53_ARUDO